MNHPPTHAEEVRVAVRSFSELFEKARYPLAIDTYQRGFVWNEEKIDQLRDDLVTFHRQDPDTTPDYYMGAILLHENRDKQRLFVIDGQQRLSALCVLHYCLLGTLPSTCKFRYSPESARNLRCAAQKLACADESLNADLFERLHFTLITVPTVDLAFTFFDTQNNRGVPLHATDLLKAYHLRAIDGKAQLRLQEDSARRWENLQHRRPILGHGEDFAPTLFARFLWRARAWNGQNGLHFEHHDLVVHEFQNKTLSSALGESEAVPLYRSRGNLLGSRLRLVDKGRFLLELRPIALGFNAADLPFAIRQPITAGIGFFLFADKYAALLRALLEEDGACAEVLAFRRFYQQVISSLSVYLREAYLLACLMYVDQFEYERLLEFALWLDHSIGSVRLDKAYVKMEAAKNFFAQRKVNLLDVVAGAFTPGQVIDQLQADAPAEAIYAAEQIEIGKGVQGRYKAQVLAYYGREDARSLKGRKRWITDGFIRERISARPS